MLARTAPIPQARQPPAYLPTTGHWRKTGSGAGAKMQSLCPRPRAWCHQRKPHDRQRGADGKQSKMPPRDPSPLQKRASSLANVPRNAAAATSTAVVVAAAAAAAVVAAAAPAVAVVHAPWTTHDPRFPAPPRAARRPSKERCAEGSRERGGRAYGIRNK